MYATGMCITVLPFEGKKYKWVFKQVQTYFFSNLSLQHFTDFVFSILQQYQNILRQSLHVLMIKV